MGEFTLEELVERLAVTGVSAQVSGDAGCVVERVATLKDAGAGDIAFLSNPKLKSLLQITKASAIILAEDELDMLAANDNAPAAIVVDNPLLAYAHVTSWLNPEEILQPGIHPTASVDPNSQIHPQAEIGAQCVVEAGAAIESGCRIGPGCFIGKQVSIGEDSRLVANVSVCHGSQIGRRVILHPGVVVGADGFGLAKDKGRWLKVPQIGKVIIGDDVDVGANTTIDRGAIGDTVIEEGVKLDNLIQIGHNVRIGAHTAIAACTAVAGSVNIGKHCAIGGCVGIVGHLDITDNVTVTGMSHVAQSIKKAGVYSSGTPLEENAQWHRNFVRLKQLDDMARRLKQIEKQQLEKQQLEKQQSEKYRDENKQ
jgi:UDP-3-O-[3-hydroxymyristoyl] glucosamine N-acyltransferase